ncbi:MAG: diacylglycerol/lipid kinase family protein [Bacteroidota bacterium]
MDRKFRTFVLINPVAGQQGAEDVEGAIASRLEEKKGEFEICRIQPGDDVRKVAEAAVRRGYNVVVAAGGDGTVSSVASALVNKDAMLGIIPSGTWNSLARNLDIPLDLSQAMDLIVQAPDARTIDVLEVDNNFYTLNVSVGIAATLMQKLDRKDIRRLGRFTFLYKGALQLLGHSPFRFTVHMNGRTTSFRASELIVANCGIVGMKNIRLDPDIHMDDGKFNVCRIYARSLRDYLSLAISMLTGRQKKDRRVVCWEGTDEIRIESKQRIPVQGDGEQVGHLPVTIKLRPHALKIVIPHREPA